MTKAQRHVEISSLLCLIPAMVIVLIICFTTPQEFFQGFFITGIFLSGLFSILLSIQYQMKLDGWTFLGCIWFGPVFFYWITFVCVYQKYIRPAVKGGAPDVSFP